MAGDLYNVSDWKIFIAGVIALPTADVDASTFSGATYVEIDGWETMGAFGDTAQVIATALINRARDVKTKGTRNAGSMENQFALLLGATPDPGQEALSAAEKTANNYMFKVEAPDNAGTTATTFEFVGMVNSYQPQGGNSNTVMLVSSGIEINSNILKTAATV